MCLRQKIQKKYAIKSEFIVIEFVHELMFDYRIRPLYILRESVPSCLLNKGTCRSPQSKRYDPILNVITLYTKRPILTQPITQWFTGFTYSTHKNNKYYLVLRLYYIISSNIFPPNDIIRRFLIFGRLHFK